jgi:hypothetical protein
MSPWSVLPASAHGLLWQASQEEVAARTIGSARSFLIDADQRADALARIARATAAIADGTNGPVKAVLFDQVRYDDVVDLFCLTTARLSPHPASAYGRSSRHDITKR